MTDTGRFLRCRRCDMGASACCCPIPRGRPWRAVFMASPLPPAARRLEESRLKVRDGDPEARP